MLDTGDLIVLGSGPGADLNGKALTVATIKSATGSFDHRAIDGSDGAHLMKALKTLLESPLGLGA